MRQITFLSLVILSFSIANTSCNKNNPITPVVVDSLSSLLPKQIIWTSAHLEDSLYTQVISIKYDTLNHQVGLYLDDTTNNNPYDHLLASYQYNHDGYLVKVTGMQWNYADFDDAVTVEINRGTDDKILSFVAEYANVSTKDSTYYFYSNTGNVITTVRYNRASPQFNDSTKYQFNNDNEVMSITKPQSDIVTYKYNGYKCISKLSSLISEQFSYPADDGTKKEDPFENLLLGKDHHLPQLQGLYPFQFAGGLMYGNIFALPATNAYHFNHVSETSDPSLHENGEADLVYENNERGLLSKVTFTYNGVLSGEAVFKY